MRLRKDFVAIGDRMRCPYCGDSDVNYVPGTSVSRGPYRTELAFACEMCGRVHFVTFRNRAGAFLRSLAVRVGKEPSQ